MLKYFGNLPCVFQNVTTQTDRELSQVQQSIAEPQVWGSQKLLTLTEMVIWDVSCG